MKIVLLGAPGAGKGTQAEKLADKYRIPLISSGNLLSAAVKAGTPQGLEAKAALEVGMGVGDELMLAIIKERLQQDDTRDGFILLGFPRSIPQAEGLDIKNHMSTISVGLAATIREWFSEGEHTTTVETSQRVDLEKVRIKTEKTKKIKKTAKAEKDAAKTKRTKNLQKIRFGYYRFYAFYQFLLFLYYCFPRL